VYLPAISVGEDQIWNQLNRMHMRGRWRSYLAAHERQVRAIGRGEQRRAGTSTTAIIAARVAQDRDA
jgi:hypothetical protein